MNAVIDKEVEAVYTGLPTNLSDAVKAEIADDFYHRVMNGVSHQQLTDRAFSILEGNLTKYGNVLSVEHRHALYELLINYTKMIQGTASGRLAFGLDTGMGKTESVVALITAIHELGLGHVSVLICQSKVEGLCELKRKLIEMNVPEDKIGLIHSYAYDQAKVINLPEGYASLPCTPRDEQRQFQLVTHNRVKGTKDISKFNSYQNKQRTLAIWDESLLASDALTITYKELDKAIHNFSVDNKDNETCKSLIKLFDSVFNRIKEGFDADLNTPCIINFEALDNDAQINYPRFIRKYGDDFNCAVLIKLLDMMSQELRLIKTREGQGLITYQVSVPADLNKVVILDASWWIRKLESLDKSILSKTHFIHPHLKRYDNVTIYRMPFSGSRSSLTNDMQSKAQHRKVSKELAAVIKTIPPDEAVLIFTFKKRGNGIDFVKTLRADLETLGINLSATIQGDNLNATDGRLRINFLTWGSETSLNEYSYCSNVILAGILHRSHIDLAGAYAGQTDDIASKIKHQDIQSLLHSEIAHLAFQALSRGSCRKVNNGYANPMKVWVIQKGDYLKTLLSKVMSGVNWKQWIEVDPVNQGIIDRTSLEISGCLDGLDKDKISTSQLRKLLKKNDMSDTTWTNALKNALSNSQTWSLLNRSLVKDYGYIGLFMSPS